MQGSFNVGEMSPVLDGRVDLPKYAFGCKKLENFLPLIQGAAMKRPGFQFVNDVVDPTQKSRLIPFEFSNVQAYGIEFADNCLAFYRNSAAVLNATTHSIASLGQKVGTHEVQLTTSTSHGLFTGDRIFVDTAVGGATELQGTFWTVTRISATVVELDNSNNDNVSTYTSGGTIAEVYRTKLIDRMTIVSATAANPVVVSVQEDLRVENGDTVYIEDQSAMFEISNRSFTVANVDTTLRTFELSGEDGSSYAAGDATGYAGKINPYNAADLDAIGYAQSADLLYLVHPDYPTAKLTRGALSHTDWSLEEIEWDWPPFSAENRDLDKYMAASAATGAGITLTSTKGDFTSDMVGGFVQFRELPSARYPEWRGQQNFSTGTWAFTEGFDFGSAFSVGDLAYYEGNVYKLLKNPVSSSGLDAPVHTVGSATDGHATWEYIHSGRGYAKITAFADAYRVTAEVIQELPKSVVVTEDTAVTTDAATNPLNVNETAHGYETGDKVYMQDFSGTGLSAINQTVQVLTRVDANNYTLDDVNGSAFGAGSGGVVLRVFEGPPSSANYLGAEHGDKTLWSIGAFSTERGYPRAVSFFEDRLWLAGTLFDSQGLWASVTSDYESHEGSDLDGSAIFVRLRTNEVNAIEWISAADVLRIGTLGPVFTLGAASTAEALTPGNVRFARASTNRSRSKVLPVPVDQVLLFVERAGREIRELVFDDASKGYVATDLNALAEHIALDQIDKMAFQQEPRRVLWSQLGDGELLGMTHDRANEVVAWHHHPLGKASEGSDVVVESVMVIPHENADRDQLWAITKRTIDTGAGDATLRHIEILADEWRKGSDLEDAQFVDDALTYDGASTTTIRGLKHLVGESVSVLADKLDVGPLTVAGAHQGQDGTYEDGTITLSTAASVVQVGLAYTAKLQTMRTLPGQGKLKRFLRFVVRLYQTGEGLKYGSTDTEDDMDTLDELEAGSLFDGDSEDNAWPDGFERDGHMTYLHSTPLPCTIVASIPTLEYEEDL